MSPGDWFIQLFTITWKDKYLEITHTSHFLFTNYRKYCQILTITHGFSFTITVLVCTTCMQSLFHNQTKELTVSTCEKDQAGTLISMCSIGGSACKYREIASLYFRYMFTFDFWFCREDLYCVNEFYTSLF